jgi:hypothetical protein
LRPRVLQVGASKKHTAIHSKTVNCVFDETLIFNLAGQTVGQLEKQVIEVSVFDANKVSRNSLIGLYEFDLLQVYYSPNHEVRCGVRERCPRPCPFPRGACGV